MAKPNPAEYKTATLFMNGRSQAVRLPKAYRFEGDRVRIHREGARVILEPVAKRGWPAGFWDEFYALPAPPDDLEATVRARRAQVDADAARRRAWLDAEFERDVGGGIEDDGGPGAR